MAAGIGWEAGPTSVVAGEGPPAGAAGGEEGPSTVEAGGREGGPASVAASVGGGPPAGAAGGE